MRGPLWWFSPSACVIAVFSQCASFAQGASARQQSEDVAASPIRNEALAQAAATRESPNGAPAAHESRKKEPPAARERRALRDKLNSGLVGIVFGGMDDADFSEAVDLGAVIGSPDIKIMSVAGNGANETVADLLFARGIDVGIVQTDVLETLKQKPPFPDVEKFLQYIAKLYDQESHVLARN